MHTYAFANATGTLVIRTADDGTLSHVPWPIPPGFNRDIWVNELSPTPTAFVPPPPSIGDVDAFMGKRLAVGFSDTGTGNTGKTWQCDDRSRGFWTAIGATAGLGTLSSPPPGTPTSFTLISADNTINSLTTAQTYALMQRIQSWIESTVMYGRTMKDNILAGNHPADITVGWP